GDTLSYYWFQEGAVQPFDVGVRVTNDFAAGTHVIRLAAWDGEESGDAWVVLNVITPGQALEDIILMLDNADTDRRNKRPLIASLKAATAAFDDGRMTPALNQLHAFQNKVR